MKPTVSQPLLWARALIAGTLTFVLGTVGHVMADGLLPGVGFLVVLAAISVLMSLPVLNRPATRARVIGLLVAGQTVVHLVLTITAGHRGDTASTPVLRAGTASLPLQEGRRIGSLQEAYTGVDPHAAVTGMALPVGHLINDLSAHAPMMAAHLVAAVLVGWWLGTGEQALWNLLAFAVARLRLAVAAVLVLVAPRSAPPVFVLPVRAGLRHARALGRRGPPVDVLAIA